MQTRTVTETLPIAPSPTRRGWSLSFGPGLVFALSVIGPTDLVSNTALGATYGYALIWALAVALLFRFVWLSASAKYVLVTGESLLTGFARLGRKVVWVILASIAVMRHFSNVSKVVLMGSAAHLLMPMPVQRSAMIWSITFTLAGFGMMFWGGYRTVERYFRILVALMGGALIVAAVRSHPQPLEILRGALIPSIPGNQGIYSTVFLLTALIGTEAGSLTNVTYSYFMHERGWRDLTFLRRQRYDLALSIGCIFLMGALLQIVAAGTLHPLGISPEGTEHLVQVFTRTLGLLGKVIFGFGLLAATFAGYIGTTTGYALIATDICRNVLPRTARATEAGKHPDELKRDPVYRAWILFWCLSPMYILLLPAKPVWLVLIVSSAMVLLVPVLAVALLRLTNDATRMGVHRNGWFSNTVLVLLVVTSSYFIFKNVAEWWPKLAKLF